MEILSVIKADAEKVSRLISDDDCCKTTTLKTSMSAQIPSADPPGDPLVSEHHVAYPAKYLFTVDEPNRCQEENPFLVLMTPVAPHNKEARDIIRKTWGKETTVLGQKISHYFLLGLPEEDDGPELLQEQVS